jgi:hypothetical protein
MIMLRCAPRSIPTYDLTEVRRVARYARVEWRRAAGIISERLGVCPPHAEALARRKVSALRPENFVGACLQRHDPSIWTDVYGLRDEDGRWFIKLAVRHGQVVIISCHGPERALTCIDGTVVEVQRP